MYVLTYPDLKAKKGVKFSKPHLARLEAAGIFPKRFYLGVGTGTAAWSESEIDDYLAACAAVRDAVTGKDAEPDTRKRRRAGGVGRGAVATA